MKNSGNKKIAKNAMFMYIRMLVTMLVSLYTTRIVLSTLGIENYGIYNVVGGIVVFFSFINAGLSGATKRYILAELAVGDITSQKNVYSLAINAHLLIVGILIIAGETIGLWLLYHAVNIPEGRMTAALVVYQASLLTAVFGIMCSPFSSVIISFEKMSVYAYFTIFEVLFKLGIVFVLQYISGDVLIWYAFLLILVSLLNYLIYYIYCRFHFEMCRYVRTKDKDTFKSILSYVGWTVFGSGANVLTRQGVGLLVNNFFTVAVNAAMGVSNMIVNVATQVVSNLQVAFAPQLTKNYLSKDYVSLKKLTFQSSRYTSFLILIILIPVTYVISDLLVVWLGTYPKYSEEFCILTLICIYIEAVSMPLTTIITSDSNIRNYQIIISCLYLLSFILCWVILLFGVLPYIVMIVRAVVDMSMVCVRLWLTKKRVHEFSIKHWCVDVYGKSIIIVLLSLPLILVFKSINTTESLVRLFVMGSISVLWVALLIGTVGFDQTERLFVVNKIKRKISHNEIRK